MPGFREPTSVDLSHRGSFNLGAFVRRWTLVRSLTTGRGERRSEAHSKDRNCQTMNLTVGDGEYARAIGDVSSGYTLPAQGRRHRLKHSSYINHAINSHETGSPERRRGSGWQFSANRASGRSRGPKPQRDGLSRPPIHIQ